MLLFYFLKNVLLQKHIIGKLENIKKNKGKVPIILLNKITYLYVDVCIS